MAIPSGITMFVRLLHPAKAAHPILVTLVGIEILSKLLQLPKAAFPILVTPSGIVMLMRA